MHIRMIMVLLASLLVLGWRSAPTIATDLSQILDDPSKFDRERVEFSARVADNPTPTGAQFKRWAFTVASNDADHLRVYENGFNPATILKAHYLVEEARKAGGQVILTGKLRAGHGWHEDSGMKLQLDSVRYGGNTVLTDVGPFVDETNSEGHPWTPLWYDGIKYYPGEFPY